MLTCYVPAGAGLTAIECAPGAPIDPRSVWIDLNQPEKSEEELVERLTGIDVPTREEMAELETSARLYQENGGLFMTAILVVKADAPLPENAPVTFILVGDRLVTVRYSDAKAFTQFAAQVRRFGTDCNHGHGVLVGLLEAVIDRTSEILEIQSERVDAVSREIFGVDKEEDGSSRRGRGRKKKDYQAILQEIGRRGDHGSRIRESLVSIGRLVSFLTQASEGQRNARDLLPVLGVLARDVSSLSDHATFLGGKINFLLDATLGMVSIEQNNIIKLFSVVAVVFLPPTLIASIYGMNFDIMPELKWWFGYPLALIAMVCSAVAPYWYFKSRGWL